jgi:hypothetical protein
MSQKQSPVKTGNQEWGNGKPLLKRENNNEAVLTFGPNGKSEMEQL